MDSNSVITNGITMISFKKYKIDPFWVKCKTYIGLDVPILNIINKVGEVVSCRNSKLVST